MNVLIVTGSYPPDHSGAGLRIKRTYDYLRDKYGVHASILAEPLRNRNGISDESDIKRINPHQALPALFLTIFIEIFRRRRQIDLIHCVGLTYMGAFAALAGKIFGIPRACELTVEHPHKASGNFLRSFISGFFFKPDGAIALTPAIADVFKSYGCPENRIFLRPNPVQMTEDEQNHKDTGFLSAVDALTCAKKHLVLGRICKRKNQAAALAILNELPVNHGLVLAGPLTQADDHDYYAKLSEYIRDKKLNNRVLVYPRAVSNPAALYRKTTSLWCLSTLEGLPNVVLEALWTGNPCIVGQNLHLAGYIISHGKNGIVVDATHPVKAAAAIAGFIDNGHNSDEIKNGARARFAPGPINEKTYEFLKTLTERRRDLPV